MKHRSLKAVKIVGLVREWYFESGWEEFDERKLEKSFASLLNKINSIINSPNKPLHSDANKLCPECKGKWAKLEPTCHLCGYIAQVI